MVQDEKQCTMESQFSLKNCMLKIVIAYFYVIVHEATGISKVRVFGVDVGQLNRNQVVNLKSKKINK